VIRGRTGIDAEAVEGAKSLFDVLNDGTLLFSKQAEGRFPDEDEILSLLS
jgi:hypothetical protein